MDEPLFPLREAPKAQQDPSGSSKDLPGKPDDDVEYYSIVKVTLDKPRAPKKSTVLLGEALEYCVLEELSQHLSAHFDHHEHDETLVRKYRRPDVPAMLIQNRFLSILTTPIEDRAIFAKTRKVGKDTSGEVHKVLGSDGSVFRLFELVLPAGTEVTRPDPGVLVLKSPRVKLMIEVQCSGFLTVLPQQFSEAYLGYPRERIEALLAKVGIRVEVNKWGLLRSAGWSYYDWVDPFVERLERFASFDLFLDRIGWDLASTMLQIEVSRGKASSRPMGRSPAQKSDA